MAAFLKGNEKPDFPSPSMGAGFTDDDDDELEEDRIIGGNSKAEIVRLLSVVIMKLPYWTTLGPI